MLKKRIFYGILIAVLLIATGLLAGRICRAKFINDSTTIINGFYEEEKNSLDAIFIGSSNCFCTVDPVALYEEYGITSYDFCSSSQPMNISVLYLQEALKTQKPKVVALEVNMMMGDTITNGYEAGLRWGYTDIPLSVNKLKAIYTSLGKVDATYFSYVFPMLRYHDRWRELTKSDYTYLFEDKWNPTKGYLMTEEVTEIPVDFSAYETQGDAYMAEDNIACLDQMLSICQENGIELMLFKSPKADWYQFQTEAIETLARERDIDFVDYNTLVEELGVDGATDFRDAEHLNHNGASKVTSHLGAYLVEQYGLEDKRIAADEDSSFARAVKYRDRTYHNQLSQIGDAATYLDTIRKMSDVTIVITADGNCGKADEELAKMLYAFRISQKNLDEEGQWVVQNGSIVFRVEGLQDYVQAIDCEKSEIVLVKQDVTTKILVDGEEYHKVDNGINIVVFDNFTGQVADAVGFDGFHDYTAVR